MLREYFSESYKDRKMSELETVDDFSELYEKERLTAEESFDEKVKQNGSPKCRRCERIVI